jgi:hypothetical protein
MIMERAQALTRLIHDPAPRADRLSLCDPVLRPCYSPVSGGVGGWGWIPVVLGFVFDIGPWVGGGVTGRQCAHPAPIGPGWPARERIPPCGTPWSCRAAPLSWPKDAGLQERLDQGQDALVCDTQSHGACRDVPSTIPLIRANRQIASLGDRVMSATSGMEP